MMGMISVGVPKEIASGENRVAATPETAKKLIKRGLEVRVENGAGLAAGFSDEDYSAAGAKITPSAQACFESDIVFKVQKPSLNEISLFKAKSISFSLLDPFVKDGSLEKLAERQVSAFCLELIPRTTRAQAMDVLSSQANLAGYRAVLEASVHYGRFFPMMMTSAGMAKPARAIVIGAGVAGLQAIATAKRLGASVEAFDVRSEVKEQIQSLGAKFIEIKLAEEGSGTGGYAKALSEETQQKLVEALGEKLQKADIIISTANIPGKKAPILITEKAVKAMRRGSVIVDLAAANGGNCPLTEKDKVVERHGVTLVGYTNYPALIATDASNFFGNNLINFLDLILKKDKESVSIHMNLEDDIVAAALVTHEGILRRS